MGMQLYRNADLIFQGSDQLLGCIRLEKTGHILDGQNMGASFLQLFGHVNIIIKGIFIPLGIHNIAGIANGGFTDLTLLQNLIHGYFHTGDPVERIENTEHIDTRSGRLLNESADQVIRIIGITHSIGAADQHL